MGWTLLLINTFYFIFLLVLILLDHSLTTSRNNYLSISFALLLFGYFYKNKKNIYSVDLVFYLLGGISIVYLSYSSLHLFPTNDFINRDILRFVHYISIIGFIIAYRSRFNNRYLVIAAYLIIIHSFFFQLNEVKGIYLLPIIVISFFMAPYPLKFEGKKNISNNSQYLSSPFLGLFILYIVFSQLITRAELIQDWIGYGLLVLIFMSFMTFNSLNKRIKIYFYRIIIGIFLLQGIVLVSYAIYQIYLTKNILDYSRVFLNLPISSLGALSLFGILFSFARMFKDNFIFRFFCYINLIFYSFLLFISHSRTSLVAVLIGVLWIGIVKYYKGRKKGYYRDEFKINISFFLVIVSLIVVGILILMNKDVSTTTLSIRLSIWQAHMLTVWEQSPYWGFGSVPEWKIFMNLSPNLSEVNLDHLRDYVENFQSFPPAHSFYIQIFSSFGISGFIILLLTLYFLFVNLKNKILPITILIGMGIHELTDYHIFEHPIIFPFLCVIAFSFPNNRYNSLRFSFVKYINAFILFCFCLWISLIVLNAKLLEIHKKDLSTVYYFHNLEFAIPKEELDANKYEVRKWSYPGLDGFSEIFPESNHILMKLFYHKARINHGKNDFENYNKYKKMCEALKNSNELCRSWRLYEPKEK